MPSPKKTAVEDLRAQAISEARALLTEGGPDQVKARVLAVRLGVSVGTIYNLFGQLDELLFQVGGQIYDELFDAIDAAAGSGASPPGDRLRALSRAYLRFVSDNETLWSGVLAFNRRGKTRVPDWYRDKERRLFGVLDEIVGDLPGVTAEQKPVASKALWAAVHGIITVSVGRDGLTASEEDVREQIDLVVEAVSRSLSAT